MQTQITSHSARSCVGCKQTDAREALMRFVRAGDPPMLVPDVRRRLGGRGASVHPRYRCLEAALRTGALRRALKADAAGSAAELAAIARGQYERRAEGLLLGAKAAGKLALGTEAVREAMAARRVELLVVAQDAEGRRDELEEAATRLGRSCVIWSTKENLGKLFGRSVSSILAVLDKGIADELRNVTRHVAELSEDS